MWDSRRKKVSSVDAERLGVVTGWLVTGLSPLGPPDSSSAQLLPPRFPICTASPGTLRFSICAASPDSNLPLLCFIPLRSCALSPANPRVDRCSVRVKMCVSIELHTGNFSGCV